MSSAPIAEGIVTVFPGGNGGPDGARVLWGSMPYYVLLTNLSDCGVYFDINEAHSVREITAGNSIYVEARVIDVKHVGSPAVPVRVQFKIMESPILDPLGFGPPGDDDLEF